jgi:hypothetical protein
MKIFFFFYCGPSQRFLRQRSGLSGSSNSLCPILRAKRYPWRFGFRVLESLFRYR